MKLEQGKSDYAQEWGWVGSDDCQSAGDAERELIANRYKLEIIGGIVDKEADYSYDDWALVRFKRKYYLVATSGCSCPSPSETWRVEAGPATLAQIRKHIVDGDYAGYTMPKRQLDDFLALLDKAAA